MNSKIWDSFQKLKNFVLDETFSLAQHELMNIGEILQSAQGRDKATLVDGLNTICTTKSGTRSGTLLHLASDAQVWNLDALKILLDCGANPEIGDEFLQSPLHRAVSHGCYCSSCNDKAASCVKILLEKSTNSKSLVNLQDREGDTALHFAARNLLPKPAAVMLDFDANIFIQNLEQSQVALNETVLTTIVQAIPSVLLVRLDRAIGEDQRILPASTSHQNYMSNSAMTENRFLKAQEYSTRMVLKIDLSFLTQKPQIFDEMDRRYVFKRGRESDFLISILKAHKMARKKLFEHPVTEAFLDQKWKRVKWWFIASRSVFLIFACFYTNFVFVYYLQNCPYVYEKDVETTEISTPAIYQILSTPDSCEPWFWNKCYGYGIFSFSLLMVVNQGFMIIFQGWEYLDHKAWALSWWLLIIGIGATSISPIFHWYPKNWIHTMAAITLFWFWTMLLATYTRIPKVALYVDMIVKVIKTVAFCVWVYGAIVLGFGFGFHVMFPDSQDFKSPVLSFVKLLLMMLGDSDYEGILGGSQIDDESFSIPAHIFYSAFLILVTIVFMNLLVGLSVSNIQEMKNTSKLAGIGGQVEAIDTLERQIFSPWVNSCYQTCGMSRLLLYLQDRFSVVSTENQYLKFKPYDSKDNVIDKKLQFKLLNLYKASFHRDSNGPNHVYESSKLTHELLHDRLQEVFQG